MQSLRNSTASWPCRVLTRSIASNAGKYDPAMWLKDYVGFMTTPGSHNDTYAESYHRDFFLNYSRGVQPKDCAKGTEGHNTAQIGGFVVSFLRRPTRRTDYCSR